MHKGRSGSHYVVVDRGDCVNTSIRSPFRSGLERNDHAACAACEQDPMMMDDEYLLAIDACGVVGSDLRPRQ